MLLDPQTPLSPVTYPQSFLFLRWVMDRQGVTIVLSLEAGKPCEDWWGGGWRAQEFGTGDRIGMSVPEAP